MRERVFTFGTDGCLVGVVTEPEGARAEAPTVVVYNVGLNHRVGPFRLWVDLARRLAAMGHLVLRFDLNGLGDSAPRRDSRSELERANLDVREALDFLAQKKGAKSFVLMGLCSGVDSAHAVSLNDPRVSGAVFIDGYTYPTLRHRVGYALRFLSPRRWRRVLRIRRTGKGLRTIGERVEIYSRDYPPRGRLAAELEQLAGRGTRMLFIYTGNFTMYFSYRGQFHQMLKPVKLGDEVELEYVPEADHLFSRLEHRAWLLNRLSTWLSRHWPNRA